MGEWSSCSANCTCGLSCSSGIRTKIQTRDVASCASDDVTCTVFPSKPVATRNCGSESCMPCNVNNSTIHGSICSVAGTILDDETGLRACNVVSGAPVCQCRSGWSGSRCHVKDSRGLVDLSGSSCAGVELTSEQVACVSVLAFCRICSAQLCVKQLSATETVRSMPHFWPFSAEQPVKHLCRHSTTGWLMLCLWCTAPFLQLVICF